jgi:hypothetical protein
MFSSPARRNRAGEAEAPSPRKRAGRDLTLKLAAPRHRWAEHIVEDARNAASASLIVTGRPDRRGSSRQTAGRRCRGVIPEKCSAPALR